MPTASATQATTSTAPASIQSAASAHPASPPPVAARASPAATKAAANASGALLILVSMSDSFISGPARSLIKHDPQQDRQEQQGIADDRRDIIPPHVSLPTRGCLSITLENHLL